MNKNQVNATCIKTGHGNPEVICGHTYLIEDCGGETYVKVTDSCGVSGEWFRSRFEINGKTAPYPLITGTKAICNKGTNTPPEDGGLIRNAEYTIFNTATPNYVRVVDSCGVSKGEWFRSRFDVCLAPAPAPARCAPYPVLPPATCKVENGMFIVWSKTSDKAPTRTYPTYRQARKVARDMAQRHGGTFYAMRAEAEYSSDIIVTKKEL